MEFEDVQYLYSVKLKQKPNAVYYQVIEAEESDIEYLYTRQFFEEESVEESTSIVFETPEEEEVVEPSVQLEELPEEKHVQPEVPMLVSETPEPVVVPEAKPRRSGRKRKQTDFLVAQKQCKMLF